MGLQSNQGSGVFLSISNGKLVRQFKQATDHSVSRVNKAGKEVHEEFYDSLIGQIKDIKTKESEYGKFWVLTVTDGTINYFLEMKYSSGYSVSFLKALPNVDLKKPVTLSPKLYIDGDKKSSVLFLNQNGAAIKHFFTKDNPNGMPQLEKIKVKGIETWDDTKRMEFLEDYVKTHILSKISSLPEVNEEEVPF